MLFMHSPAMTKQEILSFASVDDSSGDADWHHVYDGFIENLRRVGVARTTPQVGELFPDFVLPDEFGRYRQFSETVRAGPVVLSFNRGGWCPYCRGELLAWSAQSEALKDAGGRLVVATAEVGGRAAALREIVGPEAQILCDIDHGVAMSAGLTFRCNDDLQSRYLACGLDLAELYGGGGGLLPVPATFVIDPQFIVRYVFADPDFRIRAEPSDVIHRLAKLT